MKIKCFTIAIAVFFISFLFPVDNPLDRLLRGILWNQAGKF